MLRSVILPDCYHYTLILIPEREHSGYVREVPHELLQSCLIRVQYLHTNMSSDHCAMEFEKIKTNMAIFGRRKGMLYVETRIC